jgi:hypothetical protein
MDRPVQEDRRRRDPRQYLYDSADGLHTTSLHVPSIDLVVGGDVLYNQCHMFVGDTTAEVVRNGSPRWIGCRR